MIYRHSGGRGLRQVRIRQLERSKINDDEGTKDEIQNAGTRASEQWQWELLTGNILISMIFQFGGTCDLHHLQGSPPVNLTGPKLHIHYMDKSKGAFFYT